MGGWTFGHVCRCREYRVRFFSYLPGNWGFVRGRWIESKVLQLRSVTAYCLPCSYYWSMRTNFRNLLYLCDAKCSPQIPANYPPHSPSAVRGTAHPLAGEPDVERMARAKKWV